MDWLNVEPDKYNLLDRHYTPGRGGASVEFITLHHMAMIGDVDDCVRFGKNAKRAPTTPFHQQG